jgi:predicted nucleic acid-binding protein
MPVNRVFLDTSGWVALLNATDTLHAVANAVWKELGHHGYSIVLTDWVIAETGNCLARTQARNRFIETLQLFQASSHAHLIYVSDPLPCCIGLCKCTKRVLTKPGDWWIVPVLS